MAEDMLQFVAIGAGGFRLARRHVGKDLLFSLGGLGEGQEMVVVDQEGEEVELDEETIGRLKVGARYMIAAEEDLDDASFFQRAPHELGEEERSAQMQVVRGKMIKMESARRTAIQRLHRPIHSDLYSFSTSFLCPMLREAVENGCGKKDILEAIHATVESEVGVYSMPVFTDDFCQRLCEELEHLEGCGLPLVRPNSMNNYGLVLDELGFTPLLNGFREKVVQPLASVLFADTLTVKERHLGDRCHQPSADSKGQAVLDSHHGFVVQYRMGEDLSLGFHYDAADVTINVCIGKPGFTGGQLFFRGLLGSPNADDEHLKVSHNVGRGVLHRGQHRHGALPITAGARYNLIVWCRSSALSQNDSCESCSGCK